MDDKFTQKMQDWLNQPAHERDIVAGATMLLQLNRNRVLYSNIIRRPDRFAEKLEYELRKHLRIRLDGMTLADVVKMEREVMPRVASTLKCAPVITTDSELPKGKVALGKRPDHDSLPKDIQALWDDNFENFRKVKELHERLKGMANAQPCDRYEYLKMLDEADKRYRANLAKYDAYPGPTIAQPKNAIDEAVMQRDKARINAARKSISKWKAVFAKALGAGDGEKSIESKKKIESAVADLRDAGGELGEKVSAELKDLGVDVDGE